MTAGGLVHLDAAPGMAGHAVVERPAPAAHGEPRPRRAERRGAVEAPGERAGLGELIVDALHDLAAHDVAAAAALVEDGRVVEERVDEVEVLADDPAEGLHALEHTGEHAQAAADLPRREAVAHRARLLVQVARRGAEQRVAPGGVAVD